MLFIRTYFKFEIFDIVNTSKNHRMEGYVFISF